MPIYSSTALRLWVTELRATVERSGATQRFTDWLNSVKISDVGTTTEQEFLAEVHRWTPRTFTWPTTLVISDTGNIKKDFIKKALDLWQNEIEAKWYADACGCRAPNNPEYCDDRLLLGTLRFKVVKTAGNSWVVVIPATPSADTPVVNELRRPILAQLRALEAQLIPTPEPVSEGISSLVLPQSITTRHIAMGRVTPGQVQTTPVFGNLTASAPNDGELSFTFAGYSQQSNNLDYIIQMIASFHESATSVKSQPAVRFLKFTDKGFTYKVTRYNKPVLIAELEKMEFQVNVSIIEKQ